MIKSFILRSKLEKKIQQNKFKEQRSNYVSYIVIRLGGRWVAESRSKEIIMTKAQNTEIEYKHSEELVL